MADEVSQGAALEEIFELRDMFSMQVIRNGMGPANADRALERLLKIERHIRRPAEKK